MDEAVRTKYWELLGLSDLAGTMHSVDALTVTSSIYGDRFKARVFISEISNYLASEYYPSNGVHFNKIGIAKGWKKGSVAYASCPDWNACAVTGECSRKALSLILDYDDSIKCTRIDFALDAILTSGKPCLASSIYDRYPKSKEKLRLIKSVGGETLYVNKRESPNFGRLYDKSVEYGFEKGSGNVWRFEAEYKTGKAQRLLDGIKLHGDNFIRSVVIKQFRDWDIPMPLLPDSYSVPKLELQLNFGDNRLDWLIRSAPAIRALVSRDTKTEEVVRDVLNLPMFA